MSIDHALSPPRLRELVRHHAMALAFALTLLTGAGDYVTDVEMTFTLLYLFPVAIAAWFRSRSAAAAIGAVAVACQTIAFLGDEPTGRTFLAIWNAVGSFGVFVAVGGLVERLRRHVEREKAQRALVVQQLRHVERLHVIGTLVAGVAHEIATPLGVITSSAELIGADGVARTRVQQLSATIVTQAARIGTIVRGLLDHGRRGGSERALAELGAVAAAAAELLAPAAKRYRSTIAVATPAPVHARINVGELVQVVSNLILNALQAMTERGTVRVRTSIVDRERQPHACIEVEDEGPGIGEDDLARIFEPFFTTKRASDGTGLGLSISHGIVRDHGGTIEVRSQPGHGATFAVLLPLAPQRNG